MILSASPRLDGNSRMLAEACLDGALAAGHEAEIVDLGSVMSGLLRDCRRCRLSDGSCAIEDDFGAMVHEQLLPTGAVVYATPLYWYGMAATLKNFFDRLVCYVSASYPRSDEVVAGLTGKRAGLLLASEERYPGANLSIVLQMQDITRYLHQHFVGVVNGIGNKRGEVRFDPDDPLGGARRLGATIFDVHHSDYDILSERPNAVWRPAREGARAGETSPFADT